MKLIDDGFGFFGQFLAMWTSEAVLANFKDVTIVVHQLCGLPAQSFYIRRILAAHCRKSNLQAQALQGKWSNESNELKVNKRRTVCKKSKANPLIMSALR